MARDAQPIPGQSAQPSPEPRARPTPEQRARRLIEVGVDMTLATVGADAMPWVSPVFYVPDERYDLYWTSEKSARHSANIRATGSVAVVIVEPDPQRRVDAVYLSADAVELTDPGEVERGIAIMRSKPQPERWMIDSAADVVGDGPWRIYRAHARTVEVRATAQVGERPVARRQPADFRTAGCAGPPRDGE